MYIRENERLLQTQNRLHKHKHKHKHERAAPAQKD